MITLDILPTYHGTAPEYLGQYNVCSCVHMYVVGPEVVLRNRVLDTEVIKEDRV